MTHESFREKEWGSADGRRIPIKDLGLGHLVNILNWVHDHHASYSDEIRRNMIAEAEYRKLNLFAQGKAYPREVDGRWVVYDVKTKTCVIEKPPEDYIDAVKDNPRYQEMSEWVQTQRQAKKQAKK